MKAIDLTGVVFDRLTVICQIENKKAQRQWKCLCACGTVTNVTSNSLLTGKTTSCGCKQKEVGLTNCQKNAFKKTHGQTLTSTYRTWSSMIDRCKESNVTHKDAYFNRGIVVCDRWAAFENFYTDMGERPIGKTLDRIDNAGPYNPENCRWASLKEQQRNRRITNFIYVDGVKKPAAEIAELLGIKKSAMQYFITVSRKLKENYGTISVA